MDLNEIQHLDDHRVSPFDAIERVDDAIAWTRMALAESLKQLSCDALVGGESFLVLALNLLNDAREALVASVEVPS